MIRDGGDEALDRVCEHVLQGRPLLPQPTAEHIQRDEHEENQALALTLSEICALRTRIRAETRTQTQGLFEDAVSLVLVGAGGAIPQGLGTSRYTNIEVIPVDLAASATYAELVAALKTTKGNLISVGTPQVEYDEAFFSCSVDALSNEAAQALGVVSGAWVRDGSGRVIDQIFSKRSPEVSLERIKSLCPTIDREPYRLLSLALVKREEAISFLESLGSLSLCSTEALEKIYHWIVQGGFIRSLGHGIVLPR
jgi:hypothetical protein